MTLFTPGLRSYQVSGKDRNLNHSGIAQLFWLERECYQNAAPFAMQEITLLAISRDLKAGSPELVIFSRLAGCGSYATSKGQSRESDGGGSVNKVSSWKTVILLGIFCLLGAITSSAQTFKSLVNFNGTNGEYPYYGPLVQGLDGNFYGTTLGGGANNGSGTVFKVTAGGKLTRLYSFCVVENCLDGSEPVAGLILATNGNFYGTTEQGGLEDAGTIFKITPAGKLTTLYSFCAQYQCDDGGRPCRGTGSSRQRKLLRDHTGQWSPRAWWRPGRDGL
jgi:uncharacterized repeat protein (TIGR03803 family)